MKVEAKVVDFLKSHPYRTFKPKELARKLNIPTIQYRNFKQLLKKMVYEEKIFKYKKNRLGMGRKNKEVVGYIHVKTQGYGFLILENGGEDVFISHLNMGTALNGDKVKVIGGKEPSIIGSKATVKVVYDDRHFGISIDGFEKGHRLGGLLDDLSGRDMAASNLKAVVEAGDVLFTATYNGASKRFVSRADLADWLEDLDEGRLLLLCDGNIEIEDIRVFKAGGREYKVNPRTFS